MLTFAIYCSAVRRPNSALIPALVPPVLRNLIQTVVSQTVVPILSAAVLLVSFGPSAILKVLE